MITKVIKLFYNLCKRNIPNNVQYFYLYNLFTGMIFTIPIWVMFYRRVVDFPQLAFLTLLQSILTVTLEVPTGALADLIGRRKTVIAGLIVTSISILALSFSDTFLQFLICQIGIGTGEALISGADTALIYDTLKELKKENDFGKVITTSGLLYRTGLIIGSYTGGFLYGYWISLPYILKAIFILGGAVWFYFTVEPDIDSEKFSLSSFSKQTKEGVKELLKSKHIKHLTIYYIFVAGITWSCLYYFSQPFALDFGFTEKEMSLIFGSIYFLTSVLMYFVAKYTLNLKREYVYLTFPILMSFSFLPALFIPKLFAPLLLLGVQFCGSGRFTVLDKFVNQEFESKNRSTALSTLNMLVEIFVGVVVQIGGFIQNSQNTRIIFFLLGILTFIIVLPTTRLLINTHRKFVKAQA